MQTGPADPAGPDRPDTVDYASLSARLVDLWQMQVARAAADPRLRDGWKQLAGWMHAHDPDADTSGTGAPHTDTDKAGADAPGDGTHGRS